jgi:hypothetical protein
MSNPWLKRNPFMSMWLSGANSVANTVRSHATAELRRQSTLATDKAVNDWLTIWMPPTSKAPATKRRRKR